MITSDVRNIFEREPALWEELRGQRIFLTGGTGFFGRWVLESFVYINEQLKLGSVIRVLTRNKDSFAAQAPHLLRQPALEFQEGDIRTFEFPKGEFGAVLHLAATSARETYYQEDPLSKFDTLVQGTRRCLEFAAEAKAKNVLFTSSGAVYGNQPENLENVPEDYLGAPDPTLVSSHWGESKRASEFLCAYYSEKRNLNIKIARCFTFVGPFLPFDIHYAIGNFISDALSGNPIQIQGDGTPMRSYLYASDLCFWLWKILLKGKTCRPYNVGSGEGISIKDLAYLVADCSPKKVEVKIAGTPKIGSPISRYVPSTKRAERELQLTQTVSLKEAIRKTMDFALRADYAIGSRSASEKPSP